MNIEITPYFHSPEDQEDLPSPQYPIVSSQANEYNNEMNMKKNMK